jgi:hypothetical protein
MDFGALLLTILAAIAVASGFVSTMRRAAPRSKTPPVTAGWIEELSVERYRPMLRLLDPDDFQKLHSEHGCTPEAIAEIRAERCRIFQQYLRSLRADFKKVCAALKMVMAQASKDRPDLASILLRSQVQFAFHCALLELRLGLFSCGIAGVDVSALLGVFEGLRCELRAVAPSGVRAAC